MLKVEVVLILEDLFYQVVYKPKFCANQNLKSFRMFKNALSLILKPIESWFSCSSSCGCPIPMVSPEVKAEVLCTKCSEPVSSDPLINDATVPVPPLNGPAKVSIPREDANGIESLLRDLVDLYDEFRFIEEASKNQGEKELASLVCSRLDTRLALSDAEIIRDTTWKPERQRAVKVGEHEASISELEVVVTKTRSSGCAHHGKVLRKQEVEITKLKHA